jgi:hypothetical protein
MMKTRMWKILCASMFLLISGAMYAQPGSEIYLFEYRGSARGVSRLDNPRNISNRTGYDNQPYFDPNLAILYYSSADAEGRTDIIAYYYRTGETKKITETHDREYSPRLTPDNNFIACILQRDNGAQDLVGYPIKGGEPKIFIDNMIVGYHAWADENNVAVFTLPQPFKLHVVNIQTGKDTVVAENIGRSLHKIPGRNAVSYIQKLNDNEWMIMALDVKTLAKTPLIKSLPGKEKDMAWTPFEPAPVIIMSDEKKIYTFSPYYQGKDNYTEWKEVKVEGNVPQGTITRLAVDISGKYIAVVISE